MKGWRIFVHSVRQVFGNLSKALRVSGLLYLAQIAAFLVAGINIMDPAAMQQFEAEPRIGPLLIGILVTLVFGMWIAVAWHRYILLVEEPGSVLPRFNGNRLVAYLLRTLLVALIMIPIAVVLSLAAGAVAVALAPVSTPLAGIVAALIMLVPALVVGMRLSASLPGAAVGSDHGIGAAWNATRGQFPTLLVLAVAASVASMLVDVPGMLAMTAAPAIGSVWFIVTGWVKTMVGVSILTTLYGHYIEGRAIV